MKPSTISVHIENAVFHLDRPRQPGQLLDLSASEMIKPDRARFTLALDGDAVMDHKTGLMWWIDESDKLDWEANASFCKNFSLGGHSDWFQGSDEQWQTIVDRKLHNPCLPAIFKTHGDIVWTSTETAWSIAEKRTGGSRSFWCVGMNHGYVGSGHALNRFRARPVRVAAPAGQ